MATSDHIPSRIEIVVHLQALDLFSFCSAEQVLRMAEIARPRRVPRGEALYRRDDPADAMYCLYDGEVDLSAGGSEAPRRLVAPATFGVREILSDEPRTEAAQARTAVTVIALDADDFFDLLSNNIEIVKALFRQLLRSGESRSRTAQGDHGADGRNAT